MTGEQGRAALVLANDIVSRMGNADMIDIDDQLRNRRAAPWRARRSTAAELDELDGVDVLSLGMLADDVRRSRVGGTVSYTRVHRGRGDGPAGGRGAGDAAAAVR